jgi:hypothetical protein
MQRRDGRWWEPESLCLELSLIHGAAMHRPAISGNQHEPAGGRAQVAMQMQMQTADCVQRCDCGCGRVAVRCGGGSALRRATEHEVVAAGPRVIGTMSRSREMTSATLSADLLQLHHHLYVTADRVCMHRGCARIMLLYTAVKPSSCVRSALRPHHHTARHFCAAVGAAEAGALPVQSFSAPTSSFSPAYPPTAIGSHCDLCAAVTVLLPSLQRGSSKLESLPERMSILRTTHASQNAHQSPLPSGPWICSSQPSCAVQLDYHRPCISLTRLNCFLSNAPIV